MFTHIAGIVLNDTANAPPTDKNYKVYCYTNKINGKKYIGQTKYSLKQRAKNDGHGYKYCPKFWQAIQKYGWDNFSPEILKDNLSNAEAEYWENYYIKYYHTYADDENCNGYNLTLGDYNYSRSEEARRHNSIAQKERFKNNPVSDETKEKQSKAHKKYFQNDEIKEKYKNLMLKRWEDEDYKNFWTKRMKGGNNTQAKKIICLEEPDIIFDTVSDASKWCNNGSPSLRPHIKQQANGKRKSCGKHPITNEPLHWRYLDGNCRNYTE